MIKDSRQNLPAHQNLKVPIHCPARFKFNLRHALPEEVNCSLL